MQILDDTLLLDSVLRLGAATLVGGAIGTNRELAHKSAGIRTHALVALGAALVTLTAVWLSGDGVGRPDAVSRAIQGVIAGVGFLGGGVILKRDADEKVRGLTTAASLWLVACLGVACGLGMWAPTLVAMLLALVVLVAEGPVDRWVARRSRPSRDGAVPPPPAGSDRG